MDIHWLEPGLFPTAPSLLETPISERSLLIKVECCSGHNFLSISGVPAAQRSMGNVYNGIIHEVQSISFMTEDDDDEDFISNPPKTSVKIASNDIMNDFHQDTISANTGKSEQKFNPTASSNNKSSESDLPIFPTLAVSSVHDTFVTTETNKMETENEIVCPLCWKKLSDKLTGMAHVKTCGKNMPTKRIIEALELHEKQIKEWEVLGIRYPGFQDPITTKISRGDAGIDVGSRGVGKSTTKKQRKRKPVTDPELELALALSVSLNEAIEESKRKEIEHKVEAGLLDECLPQPLFVNNEVSIKEQVQKPSSFRIRFGKPPKIKLPKQLPTDTEFAIGGVATRKGRLKRDITKMRLYSVTESERQNLIDLKVSQILEESEKSKEDSKERYRFQSVEVSQGVNHRLEQYMNKDCTLWKAGATLVELSTKLDITSPSVEVEDVIHNENSPKRIKIRRLIPTEDYPEVIVDDSFVFSNRHENFGRVILTPDASINSSRVEATRIFEDSTALESLTDENPDKTITKISNENSDPLDGSILLSHNGNYNLNNSSLRRGMSYMYWTSENSTLRNLNFPKDNNCEEVQPNGTILSIHEKNCEELNSLDDSIFKNFQSANFNQEVIDDSVVIIEDDDEFILPSQNRKNFPITSTPKVHQTLVLNSPKFKKSHDNGIFPSIPETSFEEALKSSDIQAQKNSEVWDNDSFFSALPENIEYYPMGEPVQKNSRQRHASAPPESPVISKKSKFNFCAEQSKAKKGKMMLPKKLNNKHNTKSATAESNCNSEDLQSSPAWTTSTQSKVSTAAQSHTPMLNYSTLDTPILKQELKKYGLKPIPRSKAKRLLRHIYAETHKH